MSRDTALPIYEYEERAFLDEKSFLQIKQSLDEMSEDMWIDNKQSFFYVLPDTNVSIAKSPKDTKVKYKGGQLGRGNGFEEIEYTIADSSLDDALSIFTKLLNLEPQHSFQFRLNYLLPNSIEVALKYTEMWGFHLEIEKIYTASSSEEKKFKQLACEKALAKLSSTLRIHYITDSEMTHFAEQCKRNINRGTYSPEAFRDKYGFLFGL